MLRWHIGTMGFGYKDWSEVFYPRELKAADYLPFYAKHFDTVELDTTFHAVPDRDRVRNWALAVPEHFRICAKMPKQITHERDFGIAGRDNALSQFLTAIREMGDKLAVVLLQFPPSLRSPQGSQFKKLLSRLPPDVRFAVEFRHRSWFERADVTAALLREHGIAWASADYAYEPVAIIPTAPFLYIRWIGRHRRFPDMSHEQLDVTERLKWWHTEVERITTGANGAIKDVYGFFNNDYAGYAIATANRFKEMIGQKVIPTQDPRQGRLF
jgi:uncharacterized protein YecE (DUF72 family)